MKYKDKKEKVRAQLQKATHETHKVVVPEIKVISMDWKKIMEELGLEE